MICRVVSRIWWKFSGGLLQAVGDRATFQVPLAQECLPSFFDVGRGIGIDHVAVILAQLVMHVLGGMAKKVTMLVNGAALDRQRCTPESDQGGLKTGGSVDDNELRPL
jgi:hypothetical protein